MKSRQMRSPKAAKVNKRISETDPESNRTKAILPRTDQQYLSPMHIKLPKNKQRPKKDQKTSKNAQDFEEKTTKRKEKKKPMHATHGISLLNDNLEFQMTLKEEKTAPKIKAKHTEKTFRNSSKNNNADKSIKYQFTEAEPLRTQSKLAHSQNKNSCSGVSIPEEEYMFIGDEFYLINNYYPTKRLLNTFRELCTQQNKQSKFLAQNRNEKGKQKIDLKRTNIFLAARKEIQMKNKVQKIVIIQRWWRKMIASHNLLEQKSNPQITVIHNVSPVKNSFDSFEEINSITPIKPYLEDMCKEDKIVSPSTPPKDAKHEQIEIISFNSTEMIEERPKKIAFKQEDISKMIGAYKLPQNGEVDHSQNEAIFSNYTQFRISDSEANNHSESEESSQNLFSPRKDDVYPLSPTKQVEDKEPNFDLLRQFQQATKIKELIDHRIIFQKGQARPSDRSGKIGISTSILSIHTLLINFFHYYINKYRDQFISLINMPYGHSIASRVRALSGKPLPEEIEEDESGILYGLKDIIGDDKMEEYFRHVEAKENKGCNSFVKANCELEKIHFKAVLDYFNEQLNEYRPYKQINGVPYPWNHSYKALTFYFVTEDNISEVFEKAELKVLKSTSLLCGIIIPEAQNRNEPSPCETVEKFMEHYQQVNNGVVLEHNEMKEVRLIHDEVKSETFEHGFETFSCVLLEVANEVMRELVLEAVLDFPGFDFQGFIY